MAEESTVNQVKSEKTEPEDVDEIASPNETLTVITKGPPKNILPRYLCSPKGSCHDLCKYGIQHPIEAKPWITAKKRVAKSERKTKVPEENVTRKSGSTSKSSSTSRMGKPNSPVEIKEVVHEKTISSEKNSPTFAETVVSIENYDSDRKQEQSEPSSLPAQESPKIQTKREKAKNKSASSSSSRKEAEQSEPSSLPAQDSPKVQTKRDIAKNRSASSSSSRKEAEIRNKQKRTSLTGTKEKSTPPSSPSSSKVNVKKSSSMSPMKAKNLTRVSSPKDHEIVEEVKPELASSDNTPDKILHVIEPTSENLPEESTLACDETKMRSPTLLSPGDKSLKISSKKTGNSGVSASSRKGLRHVGQGTSPTLSVASHLSSGSKDRINMYSASRSPSAFSSVSSSKSSTGKRSNATFKSNKTGLSHQGENVKVGYKIRPKMGTVVGATNKVVQARKLTFRRGKVIEIQPQNNNIPRRLKFRPARLLSDDVRRDINLTRRRIDTEKKVDDGELDDANNKSEKVVPKLQTPEGSKRRIIVRKVGGDRNKIDGSKSGSEKVVLRHQNVEGKKHNPRLYNNVIEETASMLAELRKSKVKALVGAFETVISLDSPREAIPAPAEVSTAC